MITKNVDKDQVFKYAVKRFREMGREYADIVTILINTFLEKISPGGRR